MGKALRVSEVPFLLNTWDYERNMDLNPTELGVGSTKDAGWHCPKCGYKWVDPIKDRNKAKGKCPCCETHRVIVEGISDIFTLVDGLKDYYDFEKNKDIDYLTLTTHGKTKVWWTCPICGTSKFGTVESKIKKDKETDQYVVYHCRKCAAIIHNLITPISSDPALLKFWDYEKNKKIDINTTSKNSTDDAYWICPDCGYQWKESITNRSKSKGKCPCCETNRVIVEGINDIFTLVEGLKDFYDFEKNAGIDILSLRIGSPDKLYWKCPVCGHEWVSTINQKLIRENGRYKVTNCQKCYHRNRIITISETPYLLRIWDFEKNKHIDIYSTSIHCEDSAHWKCPDCGYHWEGSIKYRNSVKGICPAHEGKRKVIVPGKNDVLTLCPEITKYIDPDENPGLELSKHGVNSSVELNLKCPYCGRKWPSKLKSRIGKKKDGTYYVKNCSCSHSNLRKLSYGEQYPALSKLYDYENNPKSIFDIYTVKESSEHYYWICDKCYMSFPATIQSMIASIDTTTKGCPYCAHVKVRPGESFADVHPDIMDEYDESNTINPYEAFPYSKDEVKWKCRNDPAHKWSASFALRHAGYGKCPICYPSMPAPDINTVKALLPNIAKMWSSNNKKSANETIYTYTGWVYLICPECEQEFGTFLNEFVNGDYDCPFCNNRKPIPDKTSLKALYPEIAAIWSPNNNHTPENVFPHSTDQAKFICNICHGEYTYRVYEVVTGEKDCPYCNDRKPLPGLNTFMIRHPELMHEWDWVNNYCIVDPDNILDNNTIPVWWICSNNSNHHYMMSVKRRLEHAKRNKEPCPYCKGRRRKKKHFV